LEYKLEVEGPPGAIRIGMMPVGPRGKVWYRYICTANR
jgi:hypothetical protein